MFVSFLLQIGFRYLLNRPLGWTDEVTVLCWVWLVLWGAAFILSDRDEIRFDIVYELVPERTRRTFTVISSLALVVLIVVSLPPGTMCSS
jgi:TRAP-type C4-dicarboxylate transport system permease small subunit